MKRLFDKRNKNTIELCGSDDYTQGILKIDRYLNGDLYDKSYYMGDKTLVSVDVNIECMDKTQKDSYEDYLHKHYIANGDVQVKNIIRNVCDCVFNQMTELMNKNNIINACFKGNTNKNIEDGVRSGIYTMDYQIKDNSDTIKRSYRITFTLNELSQFKVSDI